MSDRFTSLLRVHRVAVTAEDLATAPRPQPLPRCGHCGSAQIYRDEDAGLACLQCGWRCYPDRLSAELARQEAAAIYRNPRAAEQGYSRLSPACQDRYQVVP